MSQSQESKADAAQQRSEETRSFVRTVKASTRRSQVLKDLGVPKSTYYRWLTPRA